MTEFDGIEQVSQTGHKGTPFVVIAIDTTYKGIWQFEYNDDGLSEIPGQYKYHALTKEDQNYAEKIGPLIFYLTFGRLPEHLSDASA